MSQLFTLLISLVFVALFHSLIKAKPSVFYVLAAAVAFAGVYFTYNPVAGDIPQMLTYVVQKGQVGFSFLVVVMFIGTFREGSIVRKALQPIRGELSIMATILMAAHFIPYVASYAGRLGSLGSLKASVIASLGIAVIVLVLLAVLAVTSLQVVKKAMKSNAWKQVQWLAYAFFALIFFHLLGYLIVPVQAGSMGPMIGLTFYVVVYAAYAVARTRRYLIDRRERDTALQDRV